MDTETTLEEGEILDDTVDVYTPLERPSNYSQTLTQARLPIPEIEESEEEIESSSESDSDYDCKRLKHKKRKMKLKPVKLKSNNHKKYDIWSNRVQEDVLLENLVNCDVSKVDRSRTVETYLPPSRTSNKRTHSDRNNSNLKLNKKSDSKDAVVNSLPRFILDVHVTVEDSEDDIARDIANKLYEEKEDLIRNVVITVGKEKALQLFKETQRIEEGGGMLIMNQTRRRTPGGVFLFLIRHDNNITREQQIEIFNEERTKHKQYLKAKKKVKIQEIKQRIAASQYGDANSFPRLLTQSELYTQEAPGNKTRRASEDLVVKNPPPSPVTDGHNSNDESTELNADNYVNRTILNYEDTCFDSVDNMELF